MQPAHCIPICPTLPWNCAVHCRLHVRGWVGVCARARARVCVCECEGPAAVAARTALVRAQICSRKTPMYLLHAMVAFACMLHPACGNIFCYRMDPKSSDGEWSQRQLSFFPLYLTILWRWVRAMLGRVLVLVLQYMAVCCARHVLWRVPNTCKRQMTISTVDDMHYSWSWCYRWRAHHYLAIVLSGVVLTWLVVTRRPICTTTCRTWPCASCILFGGDVCILPYFLRLGLFSSCRLRFFVNARRRKADAYMTFHPQFMIFSLYLGTLRRVQTSFLF